MDEVNVRDEGFTVLSGGVDPFVESVIPTLIVYRDS